jgi:hypothetical protein
MKKIPLKIQNRCKHKKKAICIRVVSTSKGETTTRSNGTLVLAVSVWSHDINHAPTARSFLWQLTGCLEIEIRERASESIRGGQRWQQKKARDSRLSTVVVWEEEQSLKRKVEGTIGTGATEAHTSPLGRHRNRRQHAIPLRDTLQPEPQAMHRIP